MPIVTVPSEVNGGYSQAISQAGMSQVLSPEMPVPVPLSIVGSGNWNSGLIFSDGYRFLTVAITMSTAGSLVVSQFVDLAGTIPRTPITTSIVAATSLIVDISDLKPFVTFTIQVNNASGSAGTISAFQILMAAG